MIHSNRTLTNILLCVFFAFASRSKAAIAVSGQRSISLNSVLRILMVLSSFACSSSLRARMEAKITFLFGFLGEKVGTSSHCWSCLGTEILQKVL